MTEQHRCLAGCGKAITWRFAICSNCEKIHGRKATEWPEWLRYLWIETQRERRKLKKQQQYEIPYDENEFEFMTESVSYSEN